MGKIVQVEERSSGHVVADAVDTVGIYDLIGVVPGLHGPFDFVDHLDDIPAIRLADGDVYGVLNAELAFEDGVVHAVAGLLVREEIINVPGPCGIGRDEIRPAEIRFGDMVRGTGLLFRFRRNVTLLTGTYFR